MPRRAPALFTFSGFWLLAGALAGCAHPNFGLADARPPAEAARPLPPGTDTLRHLAAGRHYNQHGAAYRALLGQHHRRVWAAPVTAPVLHLAHAGPNGQPLRPEKAGGGFQTVSLTLTSATGQAFKLRSLDKYPTNTLPPLLRRTFLLNAVRDGTSAANPYAALVVPPLAQAAGLLTPQPRLVYVRPDEAGLGPGAARLRGKLALLEEKFAGPADLTPALGGATALLTTPEMLARVAADPRHGIDEAELLRARLLDVWLGDWDRHAGQWAWAAGPGPLPGTVRYRPLAKDRDQVFFRFQDGAVPWLLHLLVPRFQTFTPRYGNVRGLVQRAGLLDQRGLARQTRADFARTAQALQRDWPDTLIARAVRRLPPAVYALEGPALAAALRQRRQDLPAAAARFYAGLARRPLVGGTARAEQFTVRRGADSVAVFVADSGRAAQHFRTYHYPQTRRLTLEGRGGHDTFVVETAPGTRRARRMRVTVVGAAGAWRVRGPDRRMQFRD